VAAAVGAGRPAIDAALVLIRNGFADDSDCRAFRFGAGVGRRRRRKGDKRQHQLQNQLQTG
jgi:hypothetical protein